MTDNNITYYTRPIRVWFSNACLMCLPACGQQNRMFTLHRETARICKWRCGCGHRPMASDERCTHNLDEKRYMVGVRIYKGREVKMVNKNSQGNREPIIFFKYF